ncbi:hypothetical protein P7C70_g5225, partial [Phenoliferia sp. Uapishka_3]
MDSESFVLVRGEEEEESYKAEVLSTVVDYFPSLRDPSSFNLTFDSLNKVRDARNLRPDQRLFIDDLLSVLSLDGPSLFPPPSATALESLLFQVLDSGNLLTAHCVVAYLLFFHSHTPADTRPAAFIRKVHLPVGHTRTIEGFYALDTGAWKAGVAALTNPHIVDLDDTLIDKTLKILSLLAPEEDRAKLVLAYWRLGGVELKGEEQAGIIIDALCESKRKIGVAEAWAMQRNWADEEGKVRLTLRVLTRCFGDNPTVSPTPHHLKILLAHPFTPAEDELTTAFCISPSPPIAQNPALAALAADWRISKFIAEGRPVDALRFGRQVSTSTMRGADERARLLRAVRETLTEVQRSIVDLESETGSSSSNRQASASGSALPNGSHITQPKWQPTPLAAPQPPPRSLLSVAKPPPPLPPPTAMDLPLSASPFLRKEKPLVSTSDGTAFGGVQKNVLRALREGANPTIGSESPARDPKGKGRADLFGASPLKNSVMSPARANGSTTMSETGGSPFPGSPRASSILFRQDGREVQLKERRPTMSGFGSRRTTSTPFASNLDLAALADGGDDSIIIHDQEDFDMESAASPPPPPPTSRPSRVIESAIPTSKRRTFSSQHHPSVSGDKRRAVSTEAEDRPSGAVKVAAANNFSESTPKKFPGGFPGDHSDLESEADANEEVEKEKPRRKTAPTRRSARASSAAALPATPRPKRAAAVAAEEHIHEQQHSTRRSSRRLAAHADEEQEEERPKRRTATKKATGSRRKAIEEEVE